MHTLKQRRRRKLIGLTLDGLLFGLLMIIFGWALCEGAEREIHRIVTACKIDQARGYDTGDCDQLLPKSQLAGK